MNCTTDNRSWTFGALLFLMAIAAVPTLAAEGYGYLDIITEPPGEKVTVFITGKNRSIRYETPVKGVRVAAGEIKIRAVKKGYETKEKEIKVEADTVTVVTIPLEKATGIPVADQVKMPTLLQDTGSLLIINLLGPVPVFIDGAEEPTGVGSFAVERISTGTHEIKAGKKKEDGKYPVEGIVEVCTKGYKLKVEISDAGIKIDPPTGCPPSS